MPSYAQLVREITPPLVWNFGKRKLPSLVRALGGHYTHIRFKGYYPTYAAARAASMGYDAPSILEKTREALLKVKRGEVRWERDAMVSDSDDLPWPLLALLTRIVATKGSREIRVLDFGGSLGSTYYWCRPFLNPEIQMQWHIVEQPEHVRVGKRDFEDEHLHFHPTIEDVLKVAKPDVMLMSGVLHYILEPEDFLEELKKWQIPYFLLDRTFLSNHAQHRVVVQEIPREIYEASYPAWVLSKERILTKIEEAYRLRWRIPDSETWEIGEEVIQNNLWAFEFKSTAAAPTV
jgi:putative methyltransferase (TIGR04325 family)